MSNTSKQDEATGIHDHRSKVKGKLKVNCLYPPKFIRDPIHDIIKIEDKLVLDILDSEPMQRLRYIKQLPLTSLVYPGAEHSRLAHSLGVYHLAKRILNQLDGNGNFDQYDRLVIMLAALLHDVGHGPFSHLFESFLKNVEYAPKGGKTEYLEHEWWTQKIIREQAELSGILDSYDNNLKEDICRIISGTYSKNWLSHIISSQFDADRMDYMLRDSHMTGVKYGLFDLNWLLRTLILENVEGYDEDDMKLKKGPRIIIEGRRGLSSLEEYLLGNFYLYKHVYFHRTVMAAETMVVNILKRAVECLKEKIDIGMQSSVLSAIARNKPISLNDYLDFNDKVVWGWISKWAKIKNDIILNELSDNLLKRKLFKVRNLGKLSFEEITKLKTKLLEVLNESQLNPEYFLSIREQSRSAYKKSLFFSKTKNSIKEIYYKDEDKNNRLLQNIDRNDHPISDTIKSLEFQDKYIYFPAEIAGNIDKELKGG